MDEAVRGRRWRPAEAAPVRCRKMELRQEVRLHGKGPVNRRDGALFPLFV